MAFQALIDGLRQHEQQLATQLLGIRHAIAALEDGPPTMMITPTAEKAPRRRRGTISAKGRAAIAAAQRARWAKIRAAKR